MRNKYIYIYLFLALLLINIGYSAINSITGEVSGLANVTPETGVFITDIILKESIDSNFNTKNFTKTNLESYLYLNSFNSYVTLNVTIYNNSLDTYSFDQVLYGSEWYDNDNIDFILMGLNKNDILKPKTGINFDIKFKYKSKNITKKDLNSIINFKFNKAFNVKYINFVNIENTYPTYALANQNLNINFISSVNNIDVKINNNLITDYTFKNNVLTINNVSGDVEIINKNWFTPIKNKDYFMIDNSLNKATYGSESWNGNVYNLHLKVINKKNSNNNYQFQMKIKNTSDIVWKLGNNYNSVLPSNFWGQSDSLNIKTSMSSKKINPGEILTVTFDINYKIINKNQNSSKTNITFLVDGKIKAIELNITYDLI